MRILPWMFQGMIFWTCARPLRCGQPRMTSRRHEDSGFGYQLQGPPLKYQITFRTSLTQTGAKFIRNVPERRIRRRSARPTGATASLGLVRPYCDPRTPKLMPTSVDGQRRRQTVIVCICLAKQMGSARVVPPLCSLVRRVGTSRGSPKKCLNF